MVCETSFVDFFCGSLGLLKISNAVLTTRDSRGNWSINMGIFICLNFIGATFIADGDHIVRFCNTQIV